MRRDPETTGGGNASRGMRRVAGGRPEAAPGRQVLGARFARPQAPNLPARPPSSALPHRKWME